MFTRYPTREKQRYIKSKLQVDWRYPPTRSTFRFKLTPGRDGRRRPPARARALPVDFTATLQLAH